MWYREQTRRLELTAKTKEKGDEEILCVLVCDSRGSGRIVRLFAPP
jgi:hypothetical protein